MRLNCHTKPPRLGETSDSIRTMKCTPAGKSVDGYRKLHSHFYVASVTNREGTGGPSGAELRSIRPHILACGPGWQGRYSFHGFRNLLQSHRVFQLTYTMTDEDERELESELARLQQEHRDLDAAIDALHQSPAPDLLRLQRLKKRKLQLRDRIAFIEDQITPDIIA
jgi:hypothetical protein